MQVVLIMFRNGGERRSFAVTRSTTIIGRREDCDLRIPVGDVSRKHCRLLLTADNVRIQDLGSSNGTLVNGQAVADAYLNAGDTVGVGPVHFVVQIDGVPSEDELAPAPSASGESALGGTALAADALIEAGGVPGLDAPAGLGDLLEQVAATPGDALIGDDDLVADDFLTDAPAELPADASIDDAPAASGEVTIDEDPVATPAEQDAAFDLTTDADPAPAAPTAAADDDWDFIVEEPEAQRSGADLDVNLD